MLVLLVGVAYAPIMQAEFSGFDDNRFIVDNPALRGWEGLRQIWLVPSASEQYYPVTVTTHWIEWQLWGNCPLGFHLVNVALHAISAVLAWRVLLRLSAPGAWLAATLFAVHPVCVESVAWVTERKNVLSLAFALAALLSYLHFEPLSADQPSAEDSTGARARWQYYLLSLALFITALASKTVVVTLPPVIMVLLWWRGKLSWETVRPLLPMFTVALAAGAMTTWLELTQVGAAGSDFAYSPVERLLIAGRAIWFYAAKDFWPHPLVFFYPKWDIRADDWRQYFYPAGAVAVLLSLWLGRKQLGRGPLAALLIFVGILLPALGLVNLYFMSFSFVADHLQYHAMLPLIALAMAGIVILYAGARLSPANKAVTALLENGPRGMHITAALIISIMTILTVQRTTVYRNAETLYRDTLGGNPQSWQARINLARELYVTDREAEAAQMLREAAALRSNDPNLLNNIGVMLLTNHPTMSDEGFQQALGYLAAAARLSPGYPDPEVNQGNAWMLRQEPAKALPHFERARQITPNNVNVLYLLGMALGVGGDWSAAAVQFDAALKIDPSFANGHYGLGVAHANLGQRDAAIQDLQRALKHSPSMAAAQQMLEELQAKSP